MTRAPIFIAEASSNHDRDLSRALAFVDAAADAGCDAVKFQLFKIDRMFAPEILARSEKHRARRQWELPLAHLAPLAERCFYRNPAWLSISKNWLCVRMSIDCATNFPLRS